ncbi:uncharacterized protein PV09_08425 [Verruconis gallopava]|uniref:Transcription factor domain-containing protein n=1 Tax=Verruconis gallopava TaxID=253628 RepID=A0A0D2A0E0_9PEZI|nr:uncharacterized protein PV09_08425 [Verruconis gallopava]KIW00083.1 hypothetical protein PV09_08425 [Verruconis gallopava]
MKTAEDILYPATQAHFRNCQRVQPISIELIKAGILIATYEYGQAQPGTAYLTITACKNMMKSLGIYPYSLQGAAQSEEFKACWTVALLERQVNSYYLRNSHNKLDRIISLKLGLQFLISDTLPEVPDENDSFAQQIRATLLLDRVLHSMDIPAKKEQYQGLPGIDVICQILLEMVQEHVERVDVVSTARHGDSAPWSVEMVRQATAVLEREKKNVQTHVFKSFLLRQSVRWKIARSFCKMRDMAALSGQDQRSSRPTEAYYRPL